MTSNQASDWKELQPLAEKVVQGEIDGFEIPYELIGLVPRQWPDGGPVMRYKGRGVILFREKAFTHYGYNVESDFARDVSNSSILANTTYGAISLGQARLVSNQPNKPVHVMMLIPGVVMGLRMKAQTIVEGQEIAAWLRATLPTAEVVVTDNEFQLFLGGAFRFKTPITKNDWKALEPRKKKTFYQLIAAGLGMVMISILHVMHILPIWMEALALLGFLVFYIKAVSILADRSNQPPSSNLR